MKIKKPIMILPSAGLIFAGLVLIISPVMAIFAFKTLETVIGIMFMLLLTIVGVWEMSVSRAVVGTQIGELPGIVKTVALAALLRVLMVLVTKDLVLTLNLVALGFEGLTLLLVVIYRRSFMPTEEEMQASLRRFAKVAVKTASQCPKCSAVVEADWTLCPDCGTRLPRYCAKCGTEVKEHDHSCCKCGMVMEVSSSLISALDTLQRTAELDGAPETRSARYARLGDGLLKVGKLDEAVDAFKKAIDSTQFDRKRTNFMVKMAVVMANKGRLDEANKLLSDAMAIDPEDVAGAKKIMDDLLKSAATCPA
ncbi:MAG: tetratricopeptide repeat protein [Methanomassiliicoccales archaeon]|nr:tetratricopeptide repeat protein [Methanomassiliicoccales archaeon]